MRTQKLGPDDTAVSNGPRGLHAAERSDPSIARDPPQVYTVADGRDAVGSIEVVEKYFVAVDLDGHVVGRFRDLKTAVRALPDGSRA